jgi:hypothetical protein
MLTISTLNGYISLGRVSMETPKLEAILQTTMESNGTKATIHGSG